MAGTRARLTTLIATLAVGAVGMLPAQATTLAYEEVNCGWGKSAAAIFYEEYDTATWRVRAKYDRDYWPYTRRTTPWSEPKPVPQGSHRIEYHPSKSQRIIGIEVESSGSVYAFGHQCFTAASESAAAAAAPVLDLVPDPNPDLLHSTFGQLLFRPQESDPVPVLLPGSWW